MRTTPPLSPAPDSGPEPTADRPQRRRRAAKATLGATPSTTPSAANDAAPTTPAPLKRKARAKAPVADAPRGGDARAIADLMPAIGATSFRKFGFIQSAIVTRWAEIVGERYGAVTRPDALRFPTGQKAGGTLHVTIVGAHAPMLQHVAPDLIDRVNRFFGYGAVGRIRMTQGLVAVPAAPAPNRPAAVQPAASRAAATPPGGLRPVADSELATVLERMAARLDAPPRLPRIS